jgi:molecular chaperone GrpE
MEENNSSVVAEQTDTSQTVSEQQESQTSELEALQSEKNELQDRLLRLQAEFDNFRKRNERERMDFAEFAGEQTVRSLLPILDDLERALNAAATSEDAAAEFVKGVELIYNRFLETLKKQGLEPINTEGAQFDPHVHEAIARTESDEHQDGTILAEFQRGYKFKGRLLRPSMVQVAAGR